MNCTYVICPHCGGCARCVLEKLATLYFGEGSRIAEWRMESFRKMWLSPSSQSITEVSGMPNLGQLNQGEEEYLRVKTFEELGRNVKRFRTKMGYSLAEFGERIGVTGSYLSRIEDASVYPSLEIMRRIMEELSISPEDLVDLQFLIESKRKPHGRKQPLSQGIVSIFSIDSAEKLGTLLWRNRVLKGLTLRTLAERLDIDPAYLSRIETGRQIASPELLKKIADELSLSATTLQPIADQLREQQRNAKGKNQFRSPRKTPLERFHEQLKELLQLIRSGAISSEEVHALLKDWNNGITAANEFLSRENEQKGGKHGTKMLAVPYNRTGKKVKNV